MNEFSYIDTRNSLNKHQQPTSQQQQQQASSSSTSITSSTSTTSLPKQQQQQPQSHHTKNSFFNKIKSAFEMFNDTQQHQQQIHQKSLSMRNIAEAIPNLKSAASTFALNQPPPPPPPPHSSRQSSQLDTITKRQALKENKNFRNSSSTTLDTPPQPLQSTLFHNSSSLLRPYAKSNSQNIYPQQQQQQQQQQQNTSQIISKQHSLPLTNNSITNRPNNDIKLYRNSLSLIIESKKPSQLLGNGTNKWPTPSTQHHHSNSNITSQSRRNLAIEEDINIYDDDATEEEEDEYEEDEYQDDVKVVAVDVDINDSELAEVNSNAEKQQQQQNKLKVTCIYEDSNDIYQTDNNNKSNKLVKSTPPQNNKENNYETKKIDINCEKTTTTTNDTNNKYDIRNNSSNDDLSYIDDRSTYSLNVKNKPINMMNNINNNINNNNANSKQKSASTEHLNESSHPPPKIQPYSGVLSKSLLSVVLKPRPLKPIVVESTTNTTKSSSTTLGPTSTLQQSYSSSSSSSSSATLPMAKSNCFSEAQSRLLKSKCASTTNLNDTSKANFDLSTLPSSYYPYQPYVSPPNSFSSKLETIDEKNQNKQQQQQPLYPTTPSSSSSTSSSIISNKTNSNRGGESTLHKYLPPESYPHLTNGDLNNTTKTVHQATNDHNNSNNQHPFVPPTSQMYNNGTNLLYNDTNVATVRQYYDKQKQEYERHAKDVNEQIRKKYELNEKNLVEKIYEMQQELSRMKCQLSNVATSSDQYDQHANRNVKQVSSGTPRATIQTSIASTQTSPPPLSLIKSSTETENNLIMRLKEENRNLKYQLDMERKNFKNEKDKWLQEKEKVLKFQKYLQVNYVHVTKQNQILENQIKNFRQQQPEQHQTPTKRHFINQQPQQQQQQPTPSQPLNQQFKKQPQQQFIQPRSKPIESDKIL